MSKGAVLHYKSYSDGAVYNTNLNFSAWLTVSVLEDVVTITINSNNIEAIFDVNWSQLFGETVDFFISDNKLTFTYQQSEDPLKIWQATLSFITSTSTMDLTIKVRGSDEVFDNWQTDNSVNLTYDQNIGVSLENTVTPPDPIDPPTDTCSASLEFSAVENDIANYGASALVITDGTVSYRLELLSGEGWRSKLISEINEDVLSIDFDTSYLEVRHGPPNFDQDGQRNFIITSWPNVAGGPSSASYQFILEIDTLSADTPSFNYNPPPDEQFINIELCHDFSRVTQ